MNPEMFSIKDKIAIVTGGARGIGRSISLALGNAGARVVVTSRTQADAERVAGEISAQGGEAIGMSTDVGDPSDVTRLVATTVDRFGTVDILVNCAGVSPYLKSAEKMTVEEWNEVLRTNLTGVFLCSTEVARLMISQQKGGAIVNISSIG